MAFLPMSIHQCHAQRPLRGGTCAYACTTMWCALPQRGFTFDSARLASATQPTLGNNASEEATPLGVVLSFAHIITHPNEIVGAVPACPPERPRSGVSIPKIHALYAGDERRMRPCRATRAGTQAPPLPISVIHPRTILPNDINHPNETRKHPPTQHIGGGNASRTPAPIL